MIAAVHIYILHDSTSTETIKLGNQPAKRLMRIAMPTCID